MSLPMQLTISVSSPHLCHCGGTLMCPTVFVVLPSLKVGSRDGTSFTDAMFPAFYAPLLSGLLRLVLE